MCQHQEQTPRTDWQEEARQQANMYPNLEEFLNHLLPENQSQFLRDFFSNAYGQSNNAQSGVQFNAQPSAPPAPENSRSDGQSNAQPSAPPAPENTQSNGQSTGQSNAQSGAQNRYDLNNNNFWSEGFYIRICNLFFLDNVGVIHKLRSLLFHNFSPPPQT